METNVSERIDPLVAIKLLHTLIWAIMAGSILALPELNLSAWIAGYFGIHLAQEKRCVTRTRTT